MIGIRLDLVVESGQILLGRFGQIMFTIQMSWSCVKVGKIELSFSGQTFTSTIGEEVLLPAVECHTVRNIGSTTNRWYYGYKKTSN